jgi:signal transduction histidine kinase
VFENLYKNAIEHNNDSVTITVGDTPSGFYIQDDGTGVGTEDIFEYGVSGSGSTGLGLSIVQKIVEAHGWEVELDSSYTDGARFVITTE